MLNGNSFIDYHDFINPNPIIPNMPLQLSTAEIVAPSPNPMTFESIMNPTSHTIMNQSRLKVSQITGSNMPVAEPEANSLTDKAPEIRIRELEQLNAHSIAAVR